MMNISKTPNYEVLKSAFKDGIEFKRTPYKTYFQKKFYSVNPPVDNEHLAKVVKGLYLEPKNIKMLITRTAILAPNWGRVAKKISLTDYSEKLIDEENSRISDTFNRGKHNPDVCFMAWYDAIAEYVLEAANRLIGVKPPVHVINEELENIETSVLKNPNYAEAKTKVYDALKKLYPKTYKKRIKLFEQNYNNKIQNGITEIVRKLVCGENSEPL